MLANLESSIQLPFDFCVTGTRVGSDILASRKECRGNASCGVEAARSCDLGIQVGCALANGHAEKTACESW